MLRDPNLEVFQSRDLEVLILTDPADEFILSHVGEFNKKQIVSVDAADLKLPPKADDAKTDDEKANDEKNQQDAPENFEER